MAAEGLLFPDARLCVETYLEGLNEASPETFPLPLDVTWRLPADAFEPPYERAVVHITSHPGGASQGYIDRSDQIRLDCYAPGQAALGTLSVVTALLVGDGIETPAGYLDNVTVVPGRAPVEVEFQSENLNQATSILEVVTRPIN